MISGFFITSLASSCTSHDCRAMKLIRTLFWNAKFEMESSIVQLYFRHRPSLRNVPYLSSYESVPVLHQLYPFTFIFSVVQLIFPFTAIALTFEPLLFSLIIILVSHSIPRKLAIRSTSDWLDFPICL